MTTRAPAPMEHVVTRAERPNSMLRIQVNGSGSKSTAGPAASGRCTVSQTVPAGEELYVTDDIGAETSGQPNEVPLHSVMADRRGL